MTGKRKKHLCSAALESHFCAAKPDGCASLLCLFCAFLSVYVDTLHNAVLHLGVCVYTMVSIPTMLHKTCAPVHCPFVVNHVVAFAYEQFSLTPPLPMQHGSRKLDRTLQLAMKKKQQRTNLHRVPFFSKPFGSVAPPTKQRPYNN